LGELGEDDEKRDVSIGAAMGWDRVSRGSDLVREREIYMCIHI
jgi:hypothetical protein